MTTFLFLDATGLPLVEFNDLGNARCSTVGRTGWLIASNRHNLYSPRLTMAEIIEGMTLLRNLAAIDDYLLTQQSETHM